MQYSDAVAFLQSFPDMERGTHGARGPTMSLDAMRSLLKRLGDPQNERRTIHITGSKGKGSTAAMLASVLDEADFRTASFTSPHLHSYTERIAFDLKPVSEEIFAEGVEQIMPIVKEE
jgi:dihydrofolate synthase/folylpolyglutamate synthase